MRYLIRCAAGILVLLGCSVTCHSEWSSAQRSGAERSEELLSGKRFFATVDSASLHQPSLRMTDRDTLALVSLRHDLNSLFHNPEFSNATFGVAIQSLKTGEYLYRLNDTKSLLPASNMKLFTSAEALALLGPEYRYKTELLTNGKIMGHTLQGELIIEGVGDPSFDTIVEGPSWLHSTFEDWAGTLRSHGIRTVTGNIIGNDSYFTSEFYPVGWAVDDLPYYYMPAVTSLAVNEDQVNMIVLGAKKAGQKPEWACEPSQEYLVIIDNAVTISPRGGVEVSGQDTLLKAYAVQLIDISRKIGTDTIVISGTIPESSSPNGLAHQEISIQNPTRYAAFRFERALKQYKIRINGRALTSRDSLSAQHKILAIDTSSPMSGLVLAMNKTSDNLYAECLFRTVAKEIGGEGSWTRGIEVMRKYLATIGIDTTRIQFTDGSGLSRMDLVTADDILTLLRYWHPRDSKDTTDLKDSLLSPSNPLSPFDTSKARLAFYNSLPIMGVDGTLENRLKGTPAQGNVHAKTGSMTGVRSISGYLTTRDGEPLAFSILANNYTCPGSDIGKLEDAVLLRLVNLSHK